MRDQRATLPDLLPETLSERGAAWLVANMPKQRRRIARAGGELLARVNHELVDLAMANGWPYAQQVMPNGSLGSIVLNEKDCHDTTINS